MWILNKLNDGKLRVNFDGTIKYLISENKSYTVGRKNCDILNEDPSMSRKHCTIYLAKQSECPFPVKTLTGVWVVDEQSKYGTYLNNNDNWIKINPNQNTKLNHGNVIRFGLMESIWRLEYKPLIVCISGIPTEQKKKIENILQTIDGCLKNTWSKECSLVIVNEISLTVKVVLALIHGVPIVTPNYMLKVVESINKQTEFPQYEMFRPDIKEILLDKSLVSLDVKNNRKELFKGKKFVIPTQKQLETLKEIVVSAGGSVELLSCNGNFERFTDDNVIVLQLPFNKVGIPEDLINSVNEITLLLKNKYGIRIVPESEIAQAVAYASTDKYCNPKSNWFNLRIGERKQVDLGPVIVEETPLQTEEMKNSPLGVIPSSATIYSISQVHANTESELITHEKRESHVNNSIENLGHQFSIAERKRTHSPSHHDYEFQQKKSRNESIPVNDDKQVPVEASVNESKTLRKKFSEPETKSTQKKKDLTKSSHITKYFQKESKPSGENSSQRVKQNSVDFWKYEKVSKVTTKRKIAIESDNPGEESHKKKPKLPENNQTIPKIRIDEPKVTDDVVERNKKCEKSLPFPSPSIRKGRHIEEENDLNGFFGKEKADALDDLNNTIFSLTLISPAYLKEDGSLIDPPSVPVNVKKFKKQKIFSSVMLTTSEENEDESLDGEWIEPHSHRLNISVA